MSVIFVLGVPDPTFDQSATESANDVITSEIISNSLTNMDLARPE
jgi:hypothetical protein